MAKLTKDEFNKKYSEKITDNDDLLIELLEDITDSLSDEESEELKSLRDELETTKAEFIELKEKYKNRFLEAVDNASENNDNEPDLEEKEVIDIKEI